MEKQLPDSVFLARLQEEKEMLLKLNDDVLSIMPLNRLNTEYKITVNAPSYLYTENYGEPILSNGPHALKMSVPREYPFVKPRIYFIDASKRTAHVDVYPTGSVSLSDVWHPESCTLRWLVERLMLHMSFSPTYIHFESMCDRHYRDWMKKMVLNRKFPTFKWSEPVTATRKIIKLN